MLASRMKLVWGWVSVLFKRRWCKLEARMFELFKKAHIAAHDGDLNSFELMGVELVSGHGFYVDKKNGEYVCQKCLRDGRKSYFKLEHIREKEKYNNIVTEFECLVCGLKFIPNNNIWYVHPPRVK